MSTPQREKNVPTPDHEPTPGVDTLAHFSEGDRIELDGRARPLTVTKKQHREMRTLNENAENVLQHRIVAEGEWADATPITLVEQRNKFSGEFIKIVAGEGSEVAREVTFAPGEVDR